MVSGGPCLDTSCSRLAALVAGGTPAVPVKSWRLRSKVLLKVEVYSIVAAAPIFPKIISLECGDESPHSKEVPPKSNNPAFALVFHVARSGLGHFPPEVTIDNSQCE